jgi:hypothetical protein
VQVLYLPPAAGAGLIVQSVPVTAPLQTVFPLATLPQGGCAMAVNGALERDGVDFIRTGATVTWVSPDFDLNPGDIVQFIYT